MSEIFLKNCRPKPVCLISVCLCPCSILQGYSLSLAPVNQQQKQLAVKVYFKWCTIQHFTLNKNKFVLDYTYTFLSATRIRPKPSTFLYFQDFQGSKLLKRIVKRAEPCKCDIRLVSRILWHKTIIPSLKWRFWYLILTSNFPP